MIFVQAIIVMGVLGAVLSVLLLTSERYLANYGICKVNINNERKFEIEGGDTLLNILTNNKIYIPSACGGQGTCGFCKVTVNKGGGPLLPTELPYLTNEEIDSLVRLACRVKIKDDIDIRVKEEYLSIKEYRAKVIHAELVTVDTREIRLELIEPAAIKFKPGQYVQVFVPGRKETVYRAYSISSSPDDNNIIELLIRLIPGGLGSTYLHNVNIGDEILFTGPFGDFKLDNEKEIVCVGGGCGLAPIRSIVKYLSKQSPDTKCHVFFGARTEKDLMYDTEFEELHNKMKNLNVHFALSHEKGTRWQGEKGFIHEVVDKFIGEEDKTSNRNLTRQAFLCGPPIMIKAATKVLVRKGLSKNEIFYDEF